MDRVLGFILFFDMGVSVRKMCKILVELMHAASGYIDDQRTGYNMSNEIHNLMKKPPLG